MSKLALFKLLDWYNLVQELILVIERPVPYEDLNVYCQINGGCLEEEQAKVSCLCLCVFVTAVNMHCEL